MSISWDISIANVNVQSGRANVTATRTDSESSLPSQVYSFNDTPIKTTQERALLLATIKAEVEKQVIKDAQIAAIITDLEQSGKSNLEDWEALR